MQSVILIGVLPLPSLYSFFLFLIYDVKHIKQLKHWRNKLDAMTKICVSSQCW